MPVRPPAGTPVLTPGHTPSFTPDQLRQLQQQWQQQHPGAFHPASGYYANGLPNWTVLDTLFTGTDGVTFGARPLSAPAPTGHVYAVALLGTWDGYTGGVMTSAVPGAPGIFVDPCFDDRSGVIRATFGAPQRTVSVEVLPETQVEGEFSTTAAPYLSAYDAGGTSVGHTVLPDAFGSPTYDHWHTLTVQVAAATIGYVEFSSTAPATDHIYGAFRRLTFHA